MKHELCAGGLLLCLGAAFACESELAQVEPRLERVEQAVIGGVESNREEVVRIVSTGAGYPRACSGTLVAPNLVLTARHCVSVFTDGVYSCTVDGTIDEAVEQVPSSAGEMGLLYSFEQIAIHVGQVPDLSEPAAIGGELIAPDTDTICHNDVAFVVLDRELSLPLGSIRLGKVVPGEDVAVVGFGTNDTGYVSRFERELSILAVGDSTYFPQGGAAMPRTFAVGQGPCPGDSGGPAISVEAGDILGVYSLVRGDCMSRQARNFYTHVGSFESIVQQAFEAAGHEELLEPPPGTGGTEGVGGLGGAGASDGSGGSEAGGGCTHGPKGGPGWGLLGLSTAAALLILRRHGLSKERRVPVRLRSAP